MSHLQDLGLVEQAAAVRGGAVRASELLASAVARIDALDGDHNAVCAVFDGDVEAVAAAAGHGPLRAVPVGVKDMFALPWRQPCDGTPVPAVGLAKGESGVSSRLRAAGALGLVSTSMHQLGIGTTGHISASGPARNPWGTQRCAGGSSGGSAAAVALRMVPAAVGTDAGGSIRIPASYCGVVGLKATWGAVPVDGYTGAYSTMGAIGPMARDTADCRLLGEALLGRPLRHPDAPQVRIGIPRASHWHDVDPGVLEACEGAVERLVRAGAIVREIVIPEAGHLALAAMLATGTERIPQLTPAWLEQVFPTLDPSVRGIIRGRLEVGAGVLQRVMRYRTMLRRWLTRAFAEVDVIAVPTVPTPPPVVERPRAQLPSGTVPVDLANLHHAGLANLTGIPAISVPCGVDADGFPVGLTFHAPWAAEAQLLGLSARFEALTDGAHVRRTVPGSGTPAKGAA